MSRKLSGEDQDANVLNTFTTSLSVRNQLRTLILR